MNINVEEHGYSVKVDPDWVLDIIKKSDLYKNATEYGPVKIVGGGSNVILYKVTLNSKKLESKHEAENLIQEKLEDLKRMLDECYEKLKGKEYVIYTDLACDESLYALKKSGFNTYAYGCEVIFRYEILD